MFVDRSNLGDVMEFKDATPLEKFDALYFGTRGRYLVKTGNSEYILTLQGSPEITLWGGVLSDLSRGTMVSASNAEFATVEVGKPLVVTNITTRGVDGVSKALTTITPVQSIERLPTFLARRGRPTSH